MKEPEYKNVVSEYNQRVYDAVSRDYRLACLERNRNHQRELKGRMKLLDTWLKMAGEP